MRRNRRFKPAQAAKKPAKSAPKKCSVCGATGRKPCTDKNGKRMGRPHKARHAND